MQVISFVIFAILAYFEKLTYPTWSKVIFSLLAVVFGYAIYNEVINPIYSNVYVKSLVLNENTNSSMAIMLLSILAIFKNYFNIHQTNKIFPFLFIFFLFTQIISNGLFIAVICLYTLKLFYNYSFANTNKKLSLLAFNIILIGTFFLKYNLLLDYKYYVLNGICVMSYLVLDQEIFKNFHEKDLSLSSIIYTTALIVFLKTLLSSNIYLFRFLPQITLLVIIFRLIFLKNSFYILFCSLLNLYLLGELNEFSLYLIFLSLLTWGRFSKETIEVKNCTTLRAINLLYFIMPLFSLPVLFTTSNLNELYKLVFVIIYFLFSFIFIKHSCFQFMYSRKLRVSTIISLLLLFLGIIGSVVNI